MPGQRAQASSALRLDRPAEQQRALEAASRLRLRLLGMSLLKLPKVSDAILAHIEGRTLEKNEWMPCPRCGGGEVTTPAGGCLGAFAGAAMIGCWLLFVLIMGVILVALFWPAGVLFIALGLVFTVLLPVIGAAIGMAYKCKSCDFSWSFADVEEYESQG